MPARIPWCGETNVSVVGVFKRVGPSGYGYHTTAEVVTSGLDLRGRRFLLTGCNSGLGLETLRVLIHRGGHVVALARTAEKARNALAATSAESMGTALACDLSDPASIRRCVEVLMEQPPVDVMVCNAGIMALPELVQKHGLEAQFLTNHIGHFLLVMGLIDRLSPDGRVVVVSSEAHRAAPPSGIEFDNLSGQRGYSPWRAYGQSKLANLLFARELAHRLPHSGQSANAVHPGIIATNLSRHLHPLIKAVVAGAAGLFLKSVAEGAATQSYAATHPALGRISGAYFSDCNEHDVSRHGADRDLAIRLWSRSEDIATRLNRTGG